MISFLHPFFSGNSSSEKSPIITPPPIPRLPTLPGALLSEPATLSNRMWYWYKKSHPLQDQLLKVEQALQNREGKTNRISNLISYQMMSVLLTLAKETTNPNYQKSKKHIQQILHSLSDQEIDYLLRTLARLEIQQQIQKTDIPVVAETLALIPLERIEKLLEQQGLNQQALEKAMATLQHVSGKILKNLPEPEKEGWFSALYSFTNFLADLAKSMSIELGHIFNQEGVHDPNDASDRLRRIYSLVGAIAALMTTVFLVTGIVIAESMLPVVQLVLISVVLITLWGTYKAYKGAPLVLSQGFKNLSTDENICSNTSFVGRINEIRQIKQCLNQLEGPNVHPILVGKTGTGKTAIVRAMATMIDNVHLYEINTAQLLDNGSSKSGTYQSRLQVLEKEIRNKEGNIILFFDEIDALFARGQSRNQALPLQFKLFLDNPKIRIIAATTNELFQETIAKDKAFLRRIRVVKIPELPKSDLVIALKKFMQQNHPEIRISDQSIDAIIALSEQESQTANIATAKKILAEAINLIDSWKGDENISLDRALQESDNIKMQLCYENMLTPEAVEKANRLLELEENIPKLRQAVEENKELIKQHKALAKMQQENVKTCADYAKILMQKTDDVAQKNFLFSYFFLTQLMETRKQEHEQLMLQRGLKIEIQDRVIERLSDLRS